MINIMTLSFTADFQSEIEPSTLVLGSSIGIFAVVILIKKITMRIKKTEKEDS